MVIEAFSRPDKLSVRGRSDTYARPDTDQKIGQQIGRIRTRNMGRAVRDEYPMGTKLRTSVGIGVVVGYTTASLRIKRWNGHIVSVAARAVIEVLK